MVYLWVEMSIYYVKFKSYERETSKFNAPHIRGYIVRLRCIHRIK